MARIRSIHPGLFTDEAFVLLSADAQIFLLGLWTEADDQGIFEWKPLTLRMRLRPTKDGPVEPLLVEIAEALCIRQFEIGGRYYGAIRNFRKFQRPKKPNAIHPITDNMRTYVGLPAPSSELDDVEDVEVLPEQQGSTEIPPQMEDGGGRRKEEGEKKDLPADAARGRSKPIDLEFEQFWKAYQPPKNSKKPDTIKAWVSTGDKRPPLPDLLRAVEEYLSWLREESRKRKSEYPKQQPSTWLRGEVWANYLSPAIDPAIAETARDRADQLLRRGKYAEIYA